MLTIFKNIKKAKRRKNKKKNRLKNLYTYFFLSIKIISIYCVILIWYISNQKKSQFYWKNDDFEVTIKTPEICIIFMKNIKKKFESWY